MSFLGGNNAIPHPGYGAPSLPRTDATSNFLDRYNTTDSYTFMNPYERMSNTHYNAQQAYGLSAYQVKTIIAGQIKTNQEESWYTSVALPRVETRNNRVNWHTIVFDNALAELTPDEGVPRIVSSSMHSETRTLHRRAIALLSEESFTNTPNGAAMYAMSLKHLATVVTDTQNYDVIMAYFNCERYDLQWARNNNYYNKKTINDIFKRDVDSFASIQKFGFAKMDADASTIHTKYGGEGFNMWILPREVRVFLGVVPDENTSFWKGGQQAVDQLKDGIGRIYDDAGSALIFGNVYKIYFTRTYAIGNGSELLNPMLRQRVIGEYIPQTSEPNQSGTNYSSNNRIIKVYDEDLDDNVLISLQDSLEAIKYMFDDNTGKIKSLTDLVPTKKYDIVKFNEHMLQHFLYRGIKSSGNSSGLSYKNNYNSEESPEPISVFGELKQDHFSSRSTLEMTKSLLKSIISQIDCVCSCEELYSDFSNGIDFISSCMNENISSYIDILPQMFSGIDNYTIEYQEPDDRHVSSSSVPILPYDNITGSSILKQLMNIRSGKNKFGSKGIDNIGKLLEDSQKQKLIILPYLTNWTGLYYLSEHGKELQGLLSETTFNTINKFVNVVKKIVLNMKYILKDCPLLDKKYTLPYYPLQSEESVFLSHLNIFQKVYPLWTDKNYSDTINDNYENLKILSKSKKPESDTEEKILEAKSMKYINDSLLLILSKVFDSGDHLYSLYLKLLSTIILYTRLSYDAIIDEKIGALSLNFNSESDKDVPLDKLSKNVQILLYSISVLRTIFRIKALFYDNDSVNKSIDNFTTVIRAVDGFGSTNLSKTMSIFVMCPQNGKDPKDGNVYENFYKITNENQKLLLQTLYDLFNSKNNEDEDTRIKFFQDFLNIIGRDFSVAPTTQKLYKWIKSQMDTSSAEDFETIFTLNESQEPTITSFDDILDGISNKFTSKIKPSKKISVQPVRTTFIINFDRLCDLYYYMSENYSIGDNNIPPITVSLPGTQYNKPATLGEIKQYIDSNTSGNENIPKKIYKKKVVVVSNDEKNEFQKTILDAIKAAFITDRGLGIFNPNDKKFNLMQNDNDDLFLVSNFFVVNAYDNIIEDIVKSPDIYSPILKRLGQYFNNYDPNSQSSLRPEKGLLKRKKSGSSTSLEEGEGEEEGGEGAEIVEKMSVPIDEQEYNTRRSKMKKLYEDHEQVGSRKYNLQYDNRTLNNNNTFDADFEDIREYVLSQNYDSYGSNPVLEQNLKLISNMNHVGDLEKLISIAILLTPIEYNTLRTIVDRNVILPMNFLHMRPYMRYQTLSGIKTRAGSDTGNTFVNVDQDNVMEGTSVETKTKLRHVSYVSAAIITNNRYVFVAYDIFCFRCLGGAGTKFYTLEDVQNDYSLSEHRYPMEKSIIVAPIPYEERYFPNPLDASGTFSYFSTQGFTNGKEQPLHYSTAALMNAIFGFRGLSDTSVQDIEIWNYHPRSDGRYITNVNPKNTIMFSGFHEIYDSRTKKYITKQGTGHFKSYAYPGCQNARNGGLDKWKLPKNVMQ